MLIVLGRGWNFTLLNIGYPSNKKDALERNLFYVACSRPKINLTVLITQQLSENSLALLRYWFGDETVQSIY